MGGGLFLNSKEKTMGFAPKDLKVGDIYELDGVKKRVTKVIHESAYDGYETEEVEEEEVTEETEEVEEEQISLADLPFSDIEEEKPKGRGRRSGTKK